jgi:hypothetical protein
MTNKYILLFISLILGSYSSDHGFFYDNPNEEILFNTNQSKISNTIFSENNLLTSSNKVKEYFSSAKKNRFFIEYYSCLISLLSSSPLSLVRVSFNITEPRKETIKEVIMALNSTKQSKLVFPDKYNDEFIIEQNRQASNDGRKNRDTIIYDTFGFNIKSKNNLNFKIAKILLVNFRKKKVNYLANLSGDVRNTYSDNKTIFDIYLKDMPEDFDLYITLEMFNKKWEAVGEKILIVQKDFNYPNFRVEDANPNKKMFIISLTFILIALILTVIFVLLKCICG